MAINPVQQYFRQPKIYISLPSQGVYNAPGTIQGDVNKIPVYGMTGMDEIMARTPDALLTGESTVKIIESCCPAIKNAWDLSTLDTEVIFSSIRIATYGNKMGVSATCKHCNTENSYDIDLGFIIEHFSKCKFDNQVILDNLIVKIQPLNYKRKSEFAMKNFQLQQKLAQVDFLENEDDKRIKIVELFKEMGEIQNEIYIQCVESVEADNKVVTERPFITEWLLNCDREVFEKIKQQIEKNQKQWTVPEFPAVCEECKKEISLRLDLDQSNFFESA